MLAQALYPSQAPIYPNSGEEFEAAAANKAWSALTRDVASEIGASEPYLKNALKKSLELSTQAFTDLLVQIEEMDSEPSLDAYAWETMSESLVRSSLSFGRYCISFLLENGHRLCCCSSRS
jgi:phosphatidylinositol 4-kinase A